MISKEKKREINKRYYEQNADKIKEQKRIKYQLSKLTTRNPKLEFSTKSFEERFDEYEEKSVKTIGYDEVSYVHDDKIGIVLLGDLHLGTEYGNYKALKDTIKKIVSKKNCYIVGLGDYADNFKKYSHGGGQHEQIMSNEIAIREVNEIFKILKGKVLGVVAGCHDMWDYDTAGKRYALHLAEIADSYWLGHGGYINININDYYYRIYARHRYTAYAGQNITHPLKRFYRERGVADIYFGAHVHQPAIEIAYSREQFIWCLVCSSWKVTDNYISKKNYADSPICIPCITLDNEKFYPQPYMDIDEMLKTL